VKSSNLLQFQNKRILLFDKRLQKITLPEKIKLDILLISDNPDADINFINKYYEYKLLIIDNTNSKMRAANLEKQVKAMHINYRILGRNKSLLLSSN
jgi:competence protein ComEC